MGCIASSLHSRPLVYKTSQVLSDAFNSFVEENCVKGSDKCVHIQKLEAAFAFYIIENNIVKPSIWWTTIEVVHRCIEQVVNASGYKLSPGFTEFKIDFTTIHLDTRYVIGLDVVRFQK